MFQEPVVEEASTRLYRMHILAYLQKKSITLIESNLFSYGLLFCIVVNTILLAIEHDGMGLKLQDALNTADSILIVIFSFELFIKLFAFGAIKYISDGFNVFDGTLVLFSWLDYFTSNSKSLSAFR